MEVFSVAQNGIWTSIFSRHSVETSPWTGIFASENLLLHTVLVWLQEVNKHVCTSQTELLPTSTKKSRKIASDMLKTQN